MFLSLSATLSRSRARRLWSSSSSSSRDQERDERVRTGVTRYWASISDKESGRRRGQPPRVGRFASSSTNSAKTGEKQRNRKRDRPSEGETASAHSVIRIHFCPRFTVPIRWTMITATLLESMAQMPKISTKIPIEIHRSIFQLPSRIVQKDEN